MKKVFFLSVLVAAFAFMSCSSSSSLPSALSNAAGSNATAKTAGASCGTALTNLYKSYKAAGKKINMSDATVIANAVALSTSIASLKENGKNADYRKSYIAGMLVGSSGMLNQTSASNMYDKLLGSISSLSGLNKNSNSAAKNTAASALSTILGLMGN